MGQVCNCFSQSKFFNFERFTQSSIRENTRNSTEITTVDKKDISMDEKDNNNNNNNDKIFSPIKKPNENPVLILSKKSKSISINDFSVEKCLGKGAFGKVLLVKHIEKEKLFAMKMIKKSDIEENQLQTNIVYFLFLSILFNSKNKIKLKK